MIGDPAKTFADRLIQAPNTGEDWSRHTTVVQPQPHFGPFVDTDDEIELWFSQDSREGKLVSRIKGQGVGKDGVYARDYLPDSSNNNLQTDRYYIHFTDCQWLTDTETVEPAYTPLTSDVDPQDPRNPEPRLDAANNDIAQNGGAAGGSSPNGGGPNGGGPNGGRS